MDNCANTGRYKELLETLAREAETKNMLSDLCDEAIFKTYSPFTQTGRLIYESFSDTELMRILTDYYLKHRICPSQKQIYCIYTLYIRTRFGNWPWALERAGIKQKSDKNAKNKHFNRKKRK